MKQIISIIIIISLSSNIGLFSQESNSQPTDERLKRIEADIEHYEGRKKTGQYLMIGGVASTIAGFAVRPQVSWGGGVYKNTGSAELMGVLLIGGALVGIYGSYLWWDAANNIAALNTAKYSFHFDYKPVMLSNKPFESGVPSLKLVIHF